MRNSFLNQISRKAVETYIARTEVTVPVAPPPAPIHPPIVTHLPLMALPMPILALPPVAQEEGIFVSIPHTPPNERVSEIDSKQAEELSAINARSMSLGGNRVETVEAIYARYLTVFPLLPELSPREESAQSDLEPQILESVPLTPPPAPISPDQSDTFVVVDLSR